MMRRRWLDGLILLLSLYAGAGFCADADLVIANVKVYSPPERVLENASVAVKGDRITYVGKESFKGTARTHIDGQGKTLIPGLIDSHVHLFIDADSDAAYDEVIRNKAPAKFADFLANGVTTLLSVGDFYPNILAVRDAVNSGEMRGPRLLISGPMIAPTAGHPTDIRECVGNPYCQSHWAMQLDDVATAREKVRELAKNKVDVIKIAYDNRIYGNPPEDGSAGEKMGHFSPEVVRALIDEAHAQGLRAAVYATPVESAIQAMEWGADVLTHGTMVIHMRPDGGLIDWPDPRLEKFANMAAQRRIPLSTCVASVSINPDLWGTQRLLHTGDDVAQWPESLRKMVENLYQQSLMDARILMEKGAVVAYATDSYRLPPGVSTRHELASLRDAGLSSDQILTMATHNAALLVGREKDLGSIAVGKIADLVLLAGDPQQNIEALARVERVWKDGEVAFDYYTDNRESSARAQVLAVDERLDRAVFENDTKTLQSLYSDDFRYFHAGAASIDTTKQAAIEHGAPDGLYLSRRRGELDTRIFGDTALISYFVTLQHDTRKFPMVPPKTRYHQQRVYAREHDEWRLVSQHSTWAVDTVEQSTEAMRYFYKQGYMNRE